MSKDKDQKKAEEIITPSPTATKPVENEMVDETTDAQGVVGDLTQDDVFVPRDGVNGPELDPSAREVEHEDDEEAA